MSDMKRRSNLRFEASAPSCRRKSGESRRALYEAASLSSDFDAAAWLAVVEEQKLAIALAAGVDPAKVSIRIGH